MHGIEAIIAEILRERDAAARRPGDYLQRIYDYVRRSAGRRARHPDARATSCVIHMGAQSNCTPRWRGRSPICSCTRSYMRRVRDGDDALLEQCANESIRMAQRSITLRQVMSPLDFDDGAAPIALDPGVMITTMLPVNNTSAAPGLERFDPATLRRAQAGDRVPAARELVSTFGHGRHSCPAQRFSISAIRIAVRRLVDAYDLEPRFTEVRPRPRQIGGVARAANACVVAYRRRGSPA